MEKPLIAIVGRPNVGKSLLFNRLARKRIAIVEDMAGTTRDRLYADCDIWGRACTIIDTGGFDPLDKEGYTPAILAQSQFAIDEADIMIFLVDGREDPTTLDYEISQVLRHTRKPVFLAANKLDSASVIQRAASHYELRLGEPIAVSAASGLGVAELTERIRDALPPETAEPEENLSTKMALVGRPNVGKSAITNHILGYDRSIVSDVPGTTRDAIDTHLEWDGEPVTLIDTAGMRRKAKVRQDKTSVEYHMVLRSLRAVDRSEVAVIVLDSGGVAEQDTKIAGYAHEAGKAVMVVVNKWDLMERDLTERGNISGRKTPAQKDYEGMIGRYLPFISYAPIHFTSAETGFGIKAMVTDALSIAKNLKMRIPTSPLNDLLRRVVAEHPPPSVKGQQLKLRYATQPTTEPPRIVVFCNHPDLLHFSYVRFIENRIREQYPFRGVPLKIELRKSGDHDDTPGGRRRSGGSVLSPRASSPRAISEEEKRRGPKTSIEHPREPKVKVTRPQVKSTAKPKTKPKSR